MTATDLLVGTAAGELGVLDFGGSGPPILLVHSPGHSAATWVLLGPLLTQNHRVIALDLRGHGLSTAPALPADEAWIDLATVIEHFALGPTTVVGHDHGSFLAGHVAIERPDLVNAVVTIDGHAVLEADQALEQFELAFDPSLTAAMAERFNLGEIARNPAEREQMIETAVSRYGDDWLLTDADPTAMRAEVERSLTPLADGSWIHTPTVDGLLAYYRFHSGSTLWPQPRMYELVRQPTLVIHCNQGGATDHFDLLTAVLGEHDHVTLRVFESGHMPHQSEPLLTATVIEEFIRDNS